MSKKIIEHFKKADTILYSAAEKIGQLEKLEKRNHEDYFFALCREIISQQLSDKAAEAIFTRFIKLFSSKKITPETILKKPDIVLRNCGMAWSKVRFIKDLAQKVKDGTLQLKKLKDLDDHLVLQEVTKVKGIGPWTAEMFLMFTLQRNDVFSHGDLGLRKAIKKLYKFKKEPTKKQVEKIVEKWKPYRTYACRILWKSLELK